jgi:hypothetical protein
LGAIVADFGRNEEGLNLFRINGSKAEIEKALQDLKNVGCEIWEDPIALEKAHKHWSVLIKIKVPEITGENITGEKEKKNENI